jgi:Tol biopolymer transport system component
MSAVPRIVIVTLVVACLARPLDSQVLPGATSRVSVASDGTQANYDARYSSVSADGRVVAFESAASNLVAGDTNGAPDIFVHDRDTGATSRVSVSTNGTEGNGGSSYAAISANGRVVAFWSYATNLVAADTNDSPDIFVHDRDTGVTSRVSVASNGTEANASSFYHAISADGRYVAFSSDATNLVSGDTNGKVDVFLHDRVTGSTTRVSVESGGAQANDDSYYPALSADGRYVAFSSDATNLVAGDTNLRTDVFVRDCVAGVTTRVSVASNGAQADFESLWPSLSADGRYVAFESDAGNLVPNDIGPRDIFVHDRATAATTLVSVSSGGAQGNGNSYSATISADGRKVAFASHASNLVTGDTNGFDDIFVHDRATGTTTRVNVPVSGLQSNDYSYQPAISADGLTVSFTSGASNLVPNDTNHSPEIFVNATATPPGAPKGLVAVPNGSTLALSWSVPAGGGAALAYSIEAGTASGLSNLANFSTSNAQTSFFATGVGNGLYFIRLRAANGHGTSGPSNEVQVRVGPATPNAPTGLTADAAGSTVTLSWTAPAAGPAPASYTVEAGSAARLSNLANFSTGSTATSFSSGGVADGTYYLRVRATNAVGSSGPSNEAILQVGPAPPGPPAALAASAAGSTVTLSWTAPTTGGAPTSYTIEAGSSPGLTNLATVATGSTATTFSAGGVATGGYYLRVRAVNSYGASPPSNEFLLCVGCAALPGASFAWQTTAVQPNGALEVRWTAATGAPTTYILDAGSAPGLSDLASIDVGNLLFNTAGVPNGTYYIHVHGRNLCGLGPASNVVKVVMF